jgi:hypothetical protein
MISGFLSSFSLPLIILVVHLIFRGRPRSEELWGGIGCSALILNFVFFAAYAIALGGGM